MIYLCPAADLTRVKVVGSVEAGRGAPGGAAPGVASPDSSPGGTLTAALAAGDPHMVFQPIIDLTTGDVCCYEALARFPHLPGFGPDVVFSRAAAMGRGPDVEALAVLKALQEPHRPVGALLSINLSPSALQSPALQSVLPADLAGLQIEITEHEQVQDVRLFMLALDRLRTRGASIAVDDVGEGYSGLQRVMSMEPDVLKLDRSLVAGVRHGSAKASLVEAIVRFAGRTGAVVCAEGIEVPEELAVLADLDVAQGQGWFIGRPGPGFPPASDASHALSRRTMSQAVVADRELDPRADDLVHVLSRLAVVTSLTGFAPVLRDAAAVMGADTVELSYVDGTRTYLSPVVDSGLGHGPGTRYYLDGLPLTRRVLDDDVAAQVVLGSPDADPGEAGWMTGDGVGSLLMVPVRSGSGVHGLFECHQVNPVPWRRKQIRDARTVAAVVGPVLANLLGPRLA